MQKLSLLSLEFTLLKRIPALLSKTPLCILPFLLAACKDINDMTILMCTHRVHSCPLMPCLIDVRVLRNE